MAANAFHGRATPHPPEPKETNPWLYIYGATVGLLCFIILIMCTGLREKSNNQNSSRNSNPQPIPPTNINNNIVVGYPLEVAYPATIAENIIDIDRNITTTPMAETH